MVRYTLILALLMLPLLSWGQEHSGTAYHWAAPYQRIDWGNTTDIGGMNTDAVSFSLGHAFNGWYTLEAQLTSNPWAVEQPYRAIIPDAMSTITPRKGDIDKTYRLYNRFILPTRFILAPYAMVAYSQSEMTGVDPADFPWERVTGHNGNELTYGLGVDYCQNSFPLCVSVEYMRLLNTDDDVHVEGASAGFRVNF